VAIPLAYNVRSAPLRWTSSLVAVLGTEGHARESDDRLTQQSPDVLRLDGDDAQFVKRIDLRTQTESGNPNWSCDFSSRGEFRELELSDDYDGVRAQVPCRIVGGATAFRPSCGLAISKLFQCAHFQKSSSRFPVAKRSARC
jgi:hypothetical protein